MSFLFGKKKTPKEMMREQQRALNRAMREVDRERVNLQNQEKRTTLEIKKLAKSGQMGAARIMAKDLVRTRQYIQKFYQMHAELQSVNLRIVTLKSTADMTEAMKGVTLAMMRMNRAINMPQMQKIMMEFQKQTEMMDMKEEMVADTMDAAMDDGNTEEETEGVVNQVLEEIGIDLSDQLTSAPIGLNATGSTVSEAPQKQLVADDGLGDLESRLNNLKK